MKKYFMTLVFFSAMMGVASAEVSPSLFSQANAKYRLGDFKNAYELYHKVIDTGRASAAAYYNLGNTALRLGQKGEALVYYQRALKASPRDSDLRWNIQVLRNAFSDRIEDKISNPLYTPFEKVLDHVALDETAYVFSGALAVLAILALLGYLFPVLRAAIGFFWVLAMAVLVLSGSMLGLQWFNGKDPRAVVLDREIIAYYGPSDTETRAFTLHEGAEGKILDQSGDWVYLSLRNKNTGWIRKNSCEII